MAVKYLLPCPACGATMPVEASQSGNLVSCGCGAKTEVPPLRELSRLERSEQAVAAVAPTWGTRQGLIFVGLVITVCAAIVAGAMFATRPKLAQIEERGLEENIAKKVEALSLSQSFEFWMYVQRYRLHAEATPEMMIMQNEIDQVNRRIYAASAVLLFGLLLTVAGLVTKPPRQEAELSPQSPSAG